MVKKYYQCHKKQKSDYGKEYRRNHKEQRADQGKRYRQTERGRLLRRFISQRRRAREVKASMDASGPTPEEFRWIIKNQKYRCNMCEKKFCKSRPATADHIIPLSKGGAHASSNIQALCGSCNSSKQAKILKGYINSWSLNSIMTNSRSGYGNKDGSQKGRNEGGRGRNQTSTCRHPTIKKKR